MVDTSEISFRLAGSADAESIAVAHVVSWRRHYRGAYADDYLDGDLLPYRQQVWAGRLQTPDASSVTIIAEADSELAGFIHVILNDDDRWGSLVDNLHVLGGHQRHGLGSALLDRAAQAVADSAATRAMYLWVLEQNTPAQAFYAARGGTRAERALVPPPSGNPGLLNGEPAMLRYVWPDVSSLLAPGAALPDRPATTTTTG